MTVLVPTNITPLRPNRAQLLAFIARGWQLFEHLSNEGEDVSRYYDGCRACAIGAGAAAADVSVLVFERWLEEADCDASKICLLSDAARDRDSAMWEIESYFAWVEGWQARMKQSPLWSCPFDGMYTEQGNLHAQWHRGYLDCVSAEITAAGKGRRK